MRDLPAAWHFRGYLPHFDDGCSLQSICYRLADALPAGVIVKIEEQARDDPHHRELIERFLDAGHGSCLLRDPENARIITAAWQYFDAQRYRLHAWCVMPNHVHVLIGQLLGFPVKAIVQSIKSYTAKAILKRCPGSRGLRPGNQRGERTIWQEEYFDRFMRNETHYLATVKYIHENPVKAGLVARAVDWPWSSAAIWERERADC